MFSLTLIDHLNLTFSQVAERHKVHTSAAQSYRRRHRWLKAMEAVLTGGVAMSAAGAAFGRGPAFATAAAVLAGAALLVLLIQLAFDFEGAAHAHAACSTRLWEIRERYGSLLSDLRDGVLDVSDARRRRDVLLDDIRAIYERTSLTPPVNLDAIEAAAKVQPAA